MENNKPKTDKEVLKAIEDLFRSIELSKKLYDAIVQKGTNLANAIKNRKSVK